MTLFSFKNVYIYKDNVLFWSRILYFCQGFGTDQKMIKNCLKKLYKNDQIKQNEWKYSKNNLKNSKMIKMWIISSSSMPFTKL